MIKEPKAEDFLTRKTMKVWAYIRKRFNRGFLAVPTQMEIADDLQMGRHSVVQALRELRQKGKLPHR